MITFNDIKKANEAIQTTNIKGKEYAEVNQRIKAFRMLYPTGQITTRLVSNEDGVCIIRAAVGYYEDGELRTLGTGTAYEKEGSTHINRTSYIENCETSAVGRALGMAGFGIDVSVASYEEVANAIHQQEELETVTDREIKVFREYAEKLGQDYRLIGKKVGATSSKSMTKRQYANALKILKEIEAGGEYHTA